jgi:glycosyltransferase involved in cell wall biosynthesis
MTFLIVTHVLHIESGNRYYAYGPYVKEMNIWIRHSDKVILIAPLDCHGEPQKIDLYYNNPSIEFIQIPQFDLLGLKSILRTLFLLPVVVKRISAGMRKADHIHLRCPGNVGLLGCIIQIFFPHKKKTAKYAGNWDWNSRQPLSYRLQQKILRSTFLSRNMTTLVYGDWPDKTKNIRPFFTASYSEKEKMPVNKISFKEIVNLAFVGGLYEYKSPLISLEVLKGLIDKGINATLTYCGDGPEREMLDKKAKDWNIKGNVFFLGNVDSEKVKNVLQSAHFLVFISKSEGWPKAVAEAMWWGCLPITTPVSCVPQMLDNGDRGDLVHNNAQQIVEIIERYLRKPEEYSAKSEKAMLWSREFTLERFESEIKKLIS